LSQGRENRPSGEGKGGKQIGKPIAFAFGETMFEFGKTARRRQGGPTVLQRERGGERTTGLRRGVCHPSMEKKRALFSKRRSFRGGGAAGRGGGGWGKMDPPRPVGQPLRNILSKRRKKETEGSLRKIHPPHAGNSKKKKVNDIKKKKVWLGENYQRGKKKRICITLNASGGEGNAFGRKQPEKIEGRKHCCKRSSKP